MVELTFFPDALLLNSLISVNYHPYAVLKPIEPGPRICASIRVRVSTLAVLFIKLVKAFVLATIEPSVDTEAVHNATIELSVEISPVLPLESSVSIHFIVFPNPLIARSICPIINSLSLFDSSLKVSDIITSIAPYFYSSTLLFLSLSKIKSLFNCCRF